MFRLHSSHFLIMHFLSDCYVFYFSTSCIFMQTHALGLYFMLGCTAERNQISRSRLHNGCRHHETHFYQLALNLLSICWNKYFGKLRLWPSHSWILDISTLPVLDSAIAQYLSSAHIALWLDRAFWCFFTLSLPSALLLMCNCKCVWAAVKSGWKVQALPCRVTPCCHLFFNLGNGERRQLGKGCWCLIKKYS